jgi:hypothetical protein
LTTRRWLESRYAGPGFVAAGILVGMVLRVVILDSTVPALTRPSGAFMIRGITNGFSASQFVEAEDDGFEGVRLEGEIGGDGRDAILEARLVELPGEGGEREARQALFAASRSQGECCVLRFPPLTDSAGRRYRLDLRARDFDGSLQLALRALPARGSGGLIVNGDPQPANLDLEPLGAALYPLKGAIRVNLWWLLVGFAVVDGAVASIVYALLTASGPLRH